MEQNNIEQEDDTPVCPHKECAYIEKKFSNNKTCIYLQKNGSYTYCSGKHKIGRYKCTLLQETFSSKTFDSSTRCFHFQGPMPEDVYADYKKGHTLGDIAAKYGITISMVRSRINRARSILKKSNP